MMNRTSYIAKHIKTVEKYQETLSLDAKIKDNRVITDNNSNIERRKRERKEIERERAREKK